MTASANFPEKFGVTSMDTATLKRECFTTGAERDSETL